MKAGEGVAMAPNLPHRVMFDKTGNGRLIFAFFLSNVHAACVHGTASMVMRCALAKRNVCFSVLLLALLRETK